MKGKGTEKVHLWEIKITKSDCSARDESLEEMENLPEPDIIASEIIENLEFALEQFQGIVEDLENK